MTIEQWGAFRTVIVVVGQFSTATEARGGGGWLVVVKIGSVGGMMFGMNSVGVVHVFGRLKKHILKFGLAHGEALHDVYAGYLNGCAVPYAAVLLDVGLAVGGAGGDGGGGGGRHWERRVGEGGWGFGRVDLGKEEASGNCFLTEL